MRTMQLSEAGAVRQWRRHAVLSEAVLEPLYELNRAYLLALARMPRQWHAAPTGSRLPDPVCIALMSLGPDERDAVARCPFSLFSARFQDDGLWAQLAYPEGVEEPSAVIDIDPAYANVVAIAQLAFFFAWHLAQANAAAARVVFGMSERTLAIFQELTLTRLQQIAIERPDLLAPRWPERATFWRALLETTRVSAGEGASDARLLGLQMLAADIPQRLQREPVRDIRGSSA
jgi:hypothetical protein